MFACCTANIIYFGWQIKNVKDAIDIGQPRKIFHLSETRLKTVDKCYSRNN